MTWIDVDIDGRHYRVVGRAAAIIGLILAYQERINVIDRGTLTIHFKGASLHPEILELLTGT